MDISTDEVTWESRRARLAASLDTADPICAAFAAVPRHLFIPERVWPELVGPALDRTADPRAWADLVYSDTPVTTEVNDGAEGRVNRPSSSSSMPSVMAKMIEAAAIGPGMRVLEIGTATGYNAAVLKHLVGADGHVVTVEIAPHLASSARRALHAAGYAVEVLTGDGAGDHAAGAPFDAVVATCAVVRVPSGWLRRTWPGGVVVVPWKPGAALPGGLLARLVVDAGGGARGGFTGGTSFMLIRSQRWRGRFHGDVARPEHVRTCADDPCRVVTDDDSGPVLAMMVPHWQWAPRRAADGSVFVAVSATDGPSWARLYPDGRVEQGGPRRLWDELESAHLRWERLGRPGITGFGLTVAADGAHTVWLGDPAGPSWEQPPDAGPG
ncbi:methyltransferase domain-containing protein [Marinactinospora rubrisoli]|uniref:Protein-L-isoaspartate O-methyltransferase n=1 Tax=Marinactinospora rubrisoli TaxID=2715399 RepID=A0ABW2KNQ1_9ACTN